MFCGEMASASATVLDCGWLVGRWLVTLMYFGEMAGWIEYRDQPPLISHCIRWRWKSPLLWGTSTRNCMLV